MMSELIWEEDAKNTYNRILHEIPTIYNNHISEKIVESCKQKLSGDGKVTQDILIASIKEVFPKVFVKTLLHNLGVIDNQQDV